MQQVIKTKLVTTILPEGYKPKDSSKTPWERASFGEKLNMLAYHFGFLLP